ncbi:hypothetical protein L596_021618 [Steinernema carpocapsae]|uniref:Uncharacterized protein n=1 Tax=Steinernema carpocapsae TaxID=34508 RepID=A0A4U5MJB7_STECR|nr:hypothetical protein L596_021618 [Steinernema carpocapsae]
MRLTHRNILQRPIIKRPWHIHHMVNSENQQGEENHLSPIEFSNASAAKESRSPRIGGTLRSGLCRCIKRLLDRSTRRGRSLKGSLS